MSRQVVSLGLVQRACSSDRKGNLVGTCEAVREAARRGATIVVLQELFDLPYFCQARDPAIFDLAQPLDGATVSTMSTLAKELSIVVIVPFFERRASGLCHNTLVVLGPDGVRLSTYRKMHIPDDPQYSEKFYFAPGDSGFRPVTTPFGRLGTLICWDQWFPEAARLLALANAQILLYPTAIGWIEAEKAQLGDAQLDAWKTMHRAHAIANGIYVAAVNRVGIEEQGDSKLEFWGHSLVCDPAGRIIAEAGESEQLLVVDCDLELIEVQRRWWPFFRDRRIDAYGGLLDRFSSGEK